MFRIAFVALFLMSALPGAASARQALQHAPDRTLELEDVTLRYRDLGGGGEPVVLLHGYTNDLRTFDGVADSIAAEYRVIALDLRGFGKSRMRNGSERFGRSMAEDVIALLDALEIPRAHVVGFSLGGVVAASVARAAPERVTSLTLLAPPLYMDSAAFARDLAPFVEDLANGRGVASFFQWVYPDVPDGNHGSTARAPGWVAAFRTNARLARTLARD